MTLISTTTYNNTKTKMELLVIIDLFKSLTKEQFIKDLLLSGENMSSLLATITRLLGLKLVIIFKLLYQTYTTLMQDNKNKLVLLKTNQHQYFQVKVNH
jgi:hypothetical protein